MKKYSKTNPTKFSIWLDGVYAKYYQMFRLSSDYLMVDIFNYFEAILPKV